MLETVDLVAGYDPEVPVLRGVSFRAERGAVTAVLGPNGSGKSTLLKAICGFALRLSGSVLLDGEKLAIRRGSDAARRGIVYVAQSRDIFRSLSVLDNLRLYGWRLRSRPNQFSAAVATVFERFAPLQLRQRAGAALLSGGEQRMLELSRALVADGSVLLLDEPSVGLSPKLARRLYEEIAALRSPERAIVLVDQNVEPALEVSDLVYTMELGAVTGCHRSAEVDPEQLVSEWLTGNGERNEGGIPDVDRS